MTIHFRATVQFKYCSLSFFETVYFRSDSKWTLEKLSKLTFLACFGSIKPLLQSILHLVVLMVPSTCRVLWQIISEFESSAALGSGPHDGLLSRAPSNRLFELWQTGSTGNKYPGDSLARRRAAKDCFQVQKSPSQWHQVRASFSLSQLNVIPATHFFMFEMCLNVIGMIDV